METKASETLEKGFVESKICVPKDPGTKIIERPDSVSMCNLKENWISHDNGSHKGSPVKLGREVDDECMISEVVNTNNQINKGPLNVNLENKPLILNNPSDFEGGSSDTLHPHDHGSPTKIEVSGDGINLLVEVFGHVDGIYDDNNDANQNGNNYALEDNKTMSFDVKNQNRDGDMGINQECTFLLGDLVWVQTRTQVWWPGMISDPSNAEKYASISEKRGTFLVKYFGNPYFIWCSNPDLRPFIEYFEDLSGKNDTKSFLGSVQKALSEIGLRVKSKMSCSCFSNESQALENKEEVCKFDVRSVPKFDPASFVADIRHLASTGLVPGKIDLIVMENRLSAFYLSVGPRSSSDGADISQDDAVIASRRKRRNHTVKSSLVLDDEIISSGKGSESRSRKKSKYLCYPYVDANQGVESNLGKDAAKNTPCGTNSWKKGSRKNLKVQDTFNASSAELLNELCATAVDYSYIHRSKYSDSLKRFYCSFRMFAFLDTKVSSKLVAAKFEGIETAEGSENQGINLEPVKESSNNESSDGIRILAKDTAQVKGKRAKNKKEEAMPTSLESKSDSFAMNTNITPDNMISFKQTCSDMPKSKKTPRKKEAATAQLPQVDMTTKPGLTGVQIGGPSADQGIPLPENCNGKVISSNINRVGQKKAFESVPPLKDVAQLNTGVGLICPSQIQSNDYIFKEPNFNATNIEIASLVQNPFQMGTSPPPGKPERKKRERKEKTSQVHSVIPDLNGNKSLPEGEPQMKMRNDESSGSNVKRRVLNKEDPGGGLLLKFAPEFPLPFKETLIATFSRFGLLKESEIQVLDETSTQIMYERSSDAGFAFRSLEKSNPFGESLVSFNLHCMPAADLRNKVKKRKPKVQQQIVDKSKNEVKAGEAPDLAVIKQNLEMMKSALEKAGDSLSPEMKAKLENEIISFLDKIGGSSSSS